MKRCIRDVVRRKRKEVYFSSSFTIAYFIITFYFNLSLNTVFKPKTYVSQLLLSIFYRLDQLLRSSLMILSLNTFHQTMTYLKGKWECKYNCFCFCEALFFFFINSKINLLVVSFEFCIFQDLTKLKCIHEVKHKFEKSSYLPLFGKLF